MEEDEDLSIQRKQWRHCVYCDRKTVESAPQNREIQERLIKTIIPGTKLSLWIPSSNKWSKGVALHEYQNGVWEVKREEENTIENPQCYHLIHHNIADLQFPTRPFPLKSIWKGARFDYKLPSPSDIICFVSHCRSLTTQKEHIRGEIEFGRRGPRCSFWQAPTLSNDENGGLLAIQAGVFLSQKYFSTKAPCSR